MAVNDSPPSTNPAPTPAAQASAPATPAPPSITVPPKVAAPTPVPSPTPPTGSPQPLQQIPADASIDKTAANILEYGVRTHASDIHIEPRDDATLIRYRIDGLLTNHMQLPANLHEPLIDYIKTLAAIKDGAPDVPQTAQFEAHFGKTPIVFRLNTLPTTLGQKATIRIIEQSDQAPDLESLGFSPAATKTMLDVLHSSRGVIIATSSILADSTMVLYALLQQFDTETNNIITIENPVLKDLTGVNQTEVDELHGLNFPTVISSALKQDPTTLMVSDMNNPTSAELMFDAALNGSLIMGGLQAQSSTLAIIRLNDMRIQPFLIASALRLIVATRRVRRLCPTCRQVYTPNADELQRITAEIGESATPTTDQSHATANSAADDSARAAFLHKKIIPAPSLEELAKKSILDRIASDPNIISRGINDQKITASQDNGAAADSAANSADPTGLLTPPAASQPPTSEPTDHGATYYRAVGCDKCNGTGYLGQLNLFEILFVTEELARAIGAGKTETELRQIAIRDGFVPLARDGLDKASRGLTTISEILRVL